jgi:GH25 family lysozyme M1 (1,4-beta-N-acetylmuramidase)
VRVGGRRGTLDAPLSTMSAAFPSFRPFARALASVALLLVATVPASAEPGDGFAGVSGDAARSPGVNDRSARATSTIPGIDVSHWQGTIDWPSVADAGKAFVFMKATEDTWYVDPTFATNRAGARANGLRVGAYHFAQPDAEPGDAKKEARWFIRHAEPQPGDLLPVLDIETSGGLDPDELTTWSTRWAAEVRRLTGVRPLVYTSPYGWDTRFGDSTALARWGSPLWVAHWGVSAPTVPAQNWGGRGWRVWQYSATGRVAGIRGDVDLDVLNGTDLDAITIQRLRVTVEGGAGTVTSEPGGLTCRTACARNFDPGTEVTLTPVADDGAVFLGWSGACGGTGACVVPMTRQRAVTAVFTSDAVAPTASITTPASHADPVVVTFDEPVRGIRAESAVLRPVDGRAIELARVCRSAGTEVACSGTNVRRLELWPLEPLTPGQAHRVTVSPHGAAIRDRAGNPAATTSAAFTASLGFEESHLPAMQRWRHVADRDAIGGSFAVEKLHGASFAARFRGSSVAWLTVVGRTYGKAEVFVDGRSRGIVDLYAQRRRTAVGRTVDGLGGGAHTIEIRALGRARAAATNTLVAVDGFRTRTGTIGTPFGGGWAPIDDPRASGGRYAVSELEGAEVRVRFRGTGIEWRAVTGRDGGRAKIVLDGELLRTVDLYAAERRFGVVHRIDGLARGAHTVRIVTTGTARAASRGTTVSIDRFDVLP